MTVIRLLMTLNAGLFVTVITLLIVRAAQQGATLSLSRESGNPDGDEVPEIIVYRANARLLLSPRLHAPSSSIYKATSARKLGRKKMSRPAA